MAEDKRPQGRFGLSRLTDIGPLVSHHNTLATECDKRVCFDGHSKEEVFRSIKDAFLSHRDNFKQELIDIDMNIEGIVITGSIVRGNFGCRGINKAKAELEQVINTQWRERFSESAVAIGDDLLVQNSVEDIWRISENKLTGLPQGEILKEDVRIAICSDIDIFVIVEGDVSRKKWESRNIQQIRDTFTTKMFNDTLGEMPYIVNISNEERFNKVTTLIADKSREGAIQSKEGFNEIIRRHY